MSLYCEYLPLSSTTIRPFPPPSSLLPYLGDGGCERGLAVIDVPNGANIQVGLCTLKGRGQCPGCLRLGGCVDAGGVEEGTGKRDGHNQGKDLPCFGTAPT